MTLEKTKSKIRGNGKRSQEFDIKRELTPGSRLHTTFFSLVLEEVIRKTAIKTSGTTCSHEHQCMIFPNDLTVITKTKTY